MSKKKRISIIIAAILICLVLVWLALKEIPHIKGNWSPDYKKEDITEIVEKKSLTNTDYKKLFYQTGLGKAGIDAVRQQGGDLIKFQDSFFRKAEMNCQQIGAVTFEDRIEQFNPEKRPPLVPLENGDILLSFSTHTLGWRHGHGGLVTNEEQDKILEAAIMGSDSQELWVNHWQRYSNFMVLRLNDTDKNQRQEIADFAAEQLNQIPYRLTSGVFGEKAPPFEGELGAQCAYIIWYAYQHFGYDLDSDGGRVVTIKDLSESPHLEVIQIYGADPAQCGF